MSRLSDITRRTVFGLAAALLVAAFPVPAFADDPASTPSTNTPTQGPNKPQGPDANTYTYNSATGMWENAYYIWNPATGQTSPKTAQTYSYNPATGHWDTTDWIYDPAKGQYVPNVVSVVQPPAGAQTIGGPADVSTQGPDSPVTDNSSNNGLFDNFYNASISNTLNSNAASGNASILLNTTGGSATSGNAAAIANFINVICAGTANCAPTLLQGASMPTFTQNIYGDVQGDIMIDPSQLYTAGPLSPIDANSSNNLTINSKANGQINNDITLGASSGNAAVSQNTTGGDATSGNADAVANILNVINSVIGTGQSFMGTVNIYGNLDGDILMPPDVLNTLLASATTPTVGLSTSGPNSPINSNSSNNLNANLKDNTSIDNLVNLSAVTGSANVTDNTTAGNATSGNANTNLTVLNLTGKQVIGSDALLVFVNVLGKWVGMIVNAPTGANAAALGGGITTNGPNSPINSDNTNNANLNSDNNSSIHNNIKATATSGNALVSQNTRGGNATSGNATASVNLMNISTSSLNLSNWLGILFINVFGSWNGSFGIDTAAGNKPASPSGGSSMASAVKAVKVFSFFPSSGSGNNYKLVQLASASQNGGSNSHNQGTALATVDRTNPPAAQASRGASLLWTAGSLFFLAGVLSAEEAYSRRKQAKANIRKYFDSITVQPFKRSAP
jgi:hypothetical protein